MEHLAPLWWWIVSMIVAFMIGYTSKTLTRTILLCVIWWAAWNALAFYWGLI